MHALWWLFVIFQCKQDFKQSIQYTGGWLNHIKFFLASITRSKEFTISIIWQRQKPHAKSDLTGIDRHKVLSQFVTYRWSGGKWHVEPTVELRSAATKAETTIEGYDFARRRTRRRIGHWEHLPARRRGSRG